MLTLIIVLSVVQLSTWLQRWWRFSQMRLRSMINDVISGAWGSSSTSCLAEVRLLLVTVVLTVAGIEGKPAVPVR